MLTLNEPHPLDVLNPALRAKLLSIAGTDVRQPYSDEEASLLIAKGTFMKGPIKVSRGIPHRCHFNAAVRWLNNPKAVIQFGYQNCYGNCWTQHSWNVLNSQIVDTDDRELYFGVTPADPDLYTMQTILGEFSPELINEMLSKRAAKKLQESYVRVRAAAEIQRALAFFVNACQP